jgi:hypothetical protein
MTKRTQETGNLDQGMILEVVEFESVKDNCLLKI